ncbi:MAG: arylesterase [Acidobacteriota bacterium]|nr:MAG: arylesterase [Acidobacteriota bacterium]
MAFGRGSSVQLLAVVIAVVFAAACGTSSADDSPTSERRARPPVIEDSRPKIVAFGDSLTAGFGLTEQESYPYLLQKRLEKDGFNYEVVNAGISGDTSLGGLERIDWVLGEKNVEILILELGANDLLRNVPVEKMKENLDRIIRKAKAKNVEVLFCGMLAPPAVGEEYQREYVNAFADLATEHDVPFVPFLLENVALNKELNQADGIHPNAKGTVIMTDNIYKELRPMLAKNEK